MATEYDNNLRGALKAVRDGVADRLGVAGSVDVDRLVHAEALHVRLGDRLPAPGPQGVEGDAEVRGAARVGRVINEPAFVQQHPVDVEQYILGVHPRDDVPSRSLIASLPIRSIRLMWLSRLTRTVGQFRRAPTCSICVDLPVP